MAKYLSFNFVSGCADDPILVRVEKNITIDDWETIEDDLNARMEELTESNSGWDTDEELVEWVLEKNDIPYEIISTDYDFYG